MMRSSLIVAASVGLYVLIVFLTFGIAVPALINMQNDGAIILAIVLLVAVAGLPFLVCPLIADLNKEPTNED